MDLADSKEQASGATNSKSMESLPGSGAPLFRPVDMASVTPCPFPEVPLLNREMILGTCRPKKGETLFLEVGESLLRSKIHQNELTLQGVPLFQRLWVRWPWWKAHASPEVLHLVSHGISPEWRKPPQIPWRERAHSAQQVAEATEILREYQTAGAVTQIPMVGT